MFDQWRDRRCRSFRQDCPQGFEPFHLGQSRHPLLVPGALVRSVQAAQSKSSHSQTFITGTLVGADGCVRYGAIALELAHRELYALEYNACELTPFAQGPTAKQHIKARGNGDGEFDLGLAGGVFDHGPCAAVASSWYLYSYRVATVRYLKGGVGVTAQSLGSAS